MSESSGSLHMQQLRERPLHDVKGKVAFITGGDSGIGLGIAHAFVDAGMKIVFTYRTRAHRDEALRQLARASDRVHAAEVDVTDRTAMADAAEDAVRVFGKVHVLVNNAGVSLSTPLSNATFDDFDWCMRTNVTGVFNGIHAFLPHIRSHGEGGQIVATSSMVGGVIVGPFWGVYSTSKFAVSGMMEALRSELAGSAIGVSLFCPSAVSSNIGCSRRNRSPEFSEIGEPDSGQAQAIAGYRDAVQRIARENGGTMPVLDAMEAGESVLRGIRNNDLYIFSHSEYAQAVRDRNEALMASFPCDELPPSVARMAFANILRNPIYANELIRKRTTDGTAD